MLVNDRTKEAVADWIEVRRESRTALEQREGEMTYNASVPPLMSSVVARFDTSVSPGRRIKF